MSAPLRLGLFGAEGRMGREIIARLAQRPAYRLAEAIDAHTAPERSFEGCDVVIDFSLPAGTTTLLARLSGAPRPLVTGVTGRDEAQQAAILAYAARAPVFIATNFSVGVAVLNHLARRAAQALGPEFDAEIFEIHHKDKVDAPSGTALSLGQAVAEGAGRAWPSARALG
ncbi:4-hydroxy-tetrahydrodipicolinate reductase, partial [Myxococcota bacterium]|nr:4-hydroxy-tetrahydrodipicolinate reductase [Myxococcota bacterium]